MISKQDAHDWLEKYCDDCGMLPDTKNLILAKHNLNYPNGWSTEPMEDLTNIGETTLNLYKDDSSGVEVEIEIDKSAPYWIYMDLYYA